MANNNENKMVYHEPEIMMIELGTSSEILTVSTQWSREYDLDEE